MSTDQLIMFVVSGLFSLYMYHLSQRARSIDDAAKKNASDIDDLKNKMNDEVKGLNDNINITVASAKRDFYKDLNLFRDKLSEINTKIERHISKSEEMDKRVIDHLDRIESKLDRQEQQYMDQSKKR